MSTVELGVRPTVYQPSLPLIPSARVDLAFIDSISLPGGASPLTYKVSGEYVEVPVGLFAEFNAVTGGVGRTIILDTAVVTGMPIYEIPAPTAQTGGVQFSYSFNQVLATPYSSGGSMAMPLPDIPLQAPATLTLTAQNATAGDVFSNVSLTVVRIPSGPLPPDTSVPTQPTPLLV